jgi:DNA (cytosine-5)-methyltransferase 1
VSVDRLRLEVEQADPGVVLDLFAGAGGWDEGLAQLGYRALGIELDEVACLTAEAAGHERVRGDISSLDPADFASGLVGMVASPPCQAFSVAGNRKGWVDEPRLIACAHELTAGNDSRGEHRPYLQDERSLLMLEPLRWALATRPRWLAIEQVPPGLGMLTLFASLLAVHGYRTAAGVLGFERYDAPQSRRRAFLVASLDHAVQLPEPVRRSFNPRSPDRVPETERHLPNWVSIAQALELSEPGRVWTNNQTHSGARPRGLTRTLSMPAHTVDGACGSWTIERGPRFRPVRLTVEQAGVLQGFRSDFPWQGSSLSQRFQQVGNAVCPPVVRHVIQEATLGTSVGVA